MKNVDSRDGQTETTENENKRKDLLIYKTQEHLRETVFQTYRQAEVITLSLHH